MKPRFEQGIEVQNGVYLHLTDLQAVDRGKWACLDSDERLRAQTLLLDRDRELYIAAHIFLRQVLSTYVELQPADWTFLRGGYGKPAVSNPGLEALHFSLSHTHGLLACAVSWRQALGVDIEQPRPLGNLRDLCRSVLSASEMAEVYAGCNSREQEQLFYTYWTLKEAYVKALGLGLNLPVQQMSCLALGEGEWCVQMDEGVLGCAVNNTPVTLSSQVCENGYPLGLAVMD